MSKPLKLAPIPGFPGYFATRDGRIWSNMQPKRGLYQMRLKKKDAGGYWIAGIMRNGKQERRRVHRLILETFVGPRPAGCQGMHDDGNKTNNHIDNLSWGTPKQNAADMTRHGTKYITQGEDCNLSRLTAVEVKEIRQHFKLGRPKTAIARIYGVTSHAITQIVTRKTWKHVL